MPFQVHGLNSAKASNTSIHMNRKFLFLLPIALLLFIALKLHAKSSETFFCKVITSPEATVVRDDSAIVSIYLFATKPMGDIELSPESPKGEDCKLRLLYLNKQGRRQAITQVDGKSYYTVLCAQYSLIGANKGRCTFPSTSKSPTRLPRQPVNSNRWANKSSKNNISPFRLP